MQHLSAQDSSVVFNLRELMRLEEQRVQNEQAAQASALRERSDRERRAQQEAIALATHREQQAALERVRIEAEVAARAETERQVALLRIRLQTGAAAHSQRAIANHPPAPAAPPELQRRRLNPVLTCILCIALCAATLGAGASSMVKGKTDLANSAASTQLAHQALELSALRKQLADMQSAQIAPAAPTVVLATSDAPSNQAAARSERRTSTAKRRALPGRPVQRAVTQLDALGDTDDPIGGLH